MTQHAEIVAALKILAQHYTKCEEDLNRLAPRLVQSDVRGEACVELTQVLNSIDVHQQTYANVLRKWQSAGFVPSSECRQWKHQAQTALESLLRVVQTMEHNAAESKSQIAPLMNLAARDHQARAAYQRASAHQ